MASKINQNGIQNPSKIDQHDAQECSESDLGSKSPKEPKGRDEINEFLAPLMRLLVPTWTQLGAKGIPKSVILAPSRDKSRQNEVQEGVLKKAWIFD